MKTLGAKVVYFVELPAVEKLKIGDEWAPEIVNCEELPSMGPDRRSAELTQII